MRPLARLAVLAALAAFAAAGAHELRRDSPKTRVAAPLADPVVAPGVGRCTSDGICIVVDDAGVHAASPIAVAP